MLQYRPLTLFWIVQFDDGTALAQFDPDTGKENRGHPDWLPSKIDDNGMIEKDGKKVPYREAYPVPKVFLDKKVKIIGWYPFSLSLSKKIFEAAKKFVMPSSVKPIVIEVKDGEQPICYRSHSIKLNLRTGGVEYAETIYVLGKKNGEMMEINEGGDVIKK